VLGLREPLSLRVLANGFDEAEADARLTVLLDWHLRLWSRGYANTKAVVLKATSSAARLHQRSLTAMPKTRAVYLNLRTEPYLATLLAGENSHIDLRGHGPERLKRLSRLGAPPPASLENMSLGEIASMTWAVETLTQRQAERTFGERVLSVDFDTLLGSPSETLRSVCAHFDLQASETFFADIGNSRVFTRYAKAQEHAYTPQLRNEIMAASRQRNAEEIRKGLQWLDRLAQRSEQVAAIVSA